MRTPARSMTSKADGLERPKAAYKGGYRVRRAIARGRQEGKRAQAGKAPSRLDVEWAGEPSRAWETKLARAENGGCGCDATRSSGAPSARRARSVFCVRTRHEGWQASCESLALRKSTSGSAWLGETQSAQRALLVRPVHEMD